MDARYKGPLFKIASICNGGGYQYAKTIPRHPKANANGLYPLHRVLTENTLNRELSSDEIVHHKDGDKYNNEPDNLEVMSQSKHASMHVSMPLVKCTCPICEKEFSVRHSFYILRLRRSKYGILFCSRSCGAKHQHNPKVVGSNPAPAISRATQLGVWRFPDASYMGLLAWFESKARVRPGVNPDHAGVRGIRYG